VRQTSPDKEYLTNNPERRCPDISKARRLLNYQPEVLVEAGVEKFLKFLWFEHQKNASP
jgi:UDP-glucuronate decarboxylase